MPTTITRRRIFCVMLVPAALILFSCSADRQAAASRKPYSVALVVPGVTEGNPLYELLTQGVDRAVKAHANATVNVVEGGYNEADWQPKIAQLVQTGNDDLIVTSGPVMAKICADLTQKYPAQRFLIFNAFLEGNPAISTVLFNRREEAFLAGYFSGLVTTAPETELEHANRGLAAGLIIGQHAALIDDVVAKAYELGLRAVNPDITLDIQALGNWFDSAKAGELARGMISDGVDVILTIAGAADAGVVTAAKEAGAYLVWFDASGYRQAPGVVIGSATIAEDRAAFEKVSAAIEGKLSFGKAVVLDAKAGYVGFDETSSQYRKYVPKSIQAALSRMMARMASGEFHLDMPTTPSAPPAQPPAP